MKQQNTDRVNSCLRSPHPSAIHLAHLHLTLSFIVLLLLLFLVIVIAVVGLTDHAKEADVTDAEVVACTELVPLVLE